MPPVVILIGNKADLSYTPDEGVVSTSEGRQRAEEIEAHSFHEISVRESVDQVIISISIPPFISGCEILRFHFEFGRRDESRARPWNERFRYRRLVLSLDSKVVLESETLGETE